MDTHHKTKTTGTHAHTKKNMDTRKKNVDTHVGRRHTDRHITDAHKNISTNKTPSDEHTKRIHEVKYIPGV